MVLIYDGMLDDPRVTRLSPASGMLWIVAIGTCNTLGRETLAVDELEEYFAQRRAHGHPGEPETLLKELAEAELAEPLPHGHVRLLARGDLWQFDEDDHAASM